MAAETTASGELQKVEVRMFSKKYSPVVLTKTAMFALHLADQAVRFVLQEHMERFLHLTMDDAKWDERHESGGVPGFISHRFKSEIVATVLCQGGKTIQVEATILLVKRHTDGEWIPALTESFLLTFPSCKALKGYAIELHPNAFRDDGEICRYTILTPGRNVMDFGRGESPYDQSMKALRETLTGGSAKILPFSGF